MTKATHTWVLAAVGALLFAVSSVVARHDGPAALPPVSPAAPGAPAAEPPPPDASETPRSRTATAARPETGWTPAFGALQADSPQPCTVEPMIIGPVPLGTIGIIGAANTGDDACVDTCWRDYGACTASVDRDFWECANDCPDPAGDLCDDCVRECRDDYRAAILDCNAKLPSCEAECP